MEAPIKLEEHLFSLKKFEEISKIYNIRNEHFTSASHRFQLLSKLTFNLVKGHFSFVYELLRSKLEATNRFHIDPNPNEQADIKKTLIKNWLQLESPNNRKFLNGKTPLIICTYITDKWAVTITRLLIQTGASLTLKDSVNSCQVLHYACARLKSSLIDILLRNVDFDLSKTTDSNGNTPLVYFMVSFRHNSHQLNVKSKKQILNSLNNYIGHLKRSQLPINTTNNFGYSLADYFCMLVTRDVLEHCQFWITMKNALIGFDQRLFKDPIGIIKRTFMISIREIISPRVVITQNSIPDANLLFMFVKKEVGKRAVAPKLETNKNVQDVYKLFWYNKATGGLCDQIEWRRDLRQLFNTLEVQRSGNFRCGTVTPMVLPELLPEPVMEVRLNKSMANLFGDLNKKTELAKLRSFHRRAVLSHSHRRT